MVFSINNYKSNPHSVNDVETLICLMFKAKHLASYHSHTTTWELSSSLIYDLFQTVIDLVVKHVNSFLWYAYKSKNTTNSVQRYCSLSCAHVYRPSYRKTLSEHTELIITLHICTVQARSSS